MDPRQFCVWGLRTIGEGEIRYNPMSYHNGSVWPHDTAIAAMGMSRYGFRQQTCRILEGMFEVSRAMDLNRLPELFCGFAKRSSQGPTLYPVACTPHAWASATPFTLLQASLGLEFDPFRNEIRLYNPRLPGFLEEVMLRNLQLGSSRVDLRVRRHGDTVSLDTPRIDGGIRVSIVHSS